MGWSLLESGPWPLLLLLTLEAVLALLVVVAWWTTAALTAESTSPSATAKATGTIRGVLQICAVALLTSAILLLRQRLLWPIVDRPWDTLRRIVNIQSLVDGAWDGLDLGTKLLLDAVEVEAVLPVDQIDGQTKMTESPGAANAVEVRLGILWEIEVDDHVDSLNIDTTGQQI